MSCLTFASDRAWMAFMVFRVCLIEDLMLSIAVFQINMSALRRSRGVYCVSRVVRSQGVSRDSE